MYVRAYVYVDMFVDIDQEEEEKKDLRSSRITKKLKFLFSL